MTNKTYRVVDVAEGLTIQGHDMTNPNAESLRLVREGMTAEARAALAHLLKRALTVIAIETLLIEHDERLQAAINDLHHIVREVTR